MEKNNKNDLFADFRFSRDLPDLPYQWLKKYSITTDEIERYQLLWEPDRQWLVFPFYEFGELAAINGRNFGEGRKYYTFGKRKNFHVWGVPDSDTLIFVEDCLSAIKVGRSFATHPVLGAHIDATALIRASERFSRLGVWLDQDKAKDAAKAVLRASVSLPGKVFRVTTTDDPKVYTEQEISRFVELSVKGVV